MCHCTQLTSFYSQLGALLPSTGSAAVTNPKKKAHHEVDAGAQLHSSMSRYVREEAVRVQGQSVPTRWIKRDVVGVGDLAQVTQHLPSKYKTLISIPSTLPPQKRCCGYCQPHHVVASHHFPRGPSSTHSCLVHLSRHCSLTVFEVELS